MHKAVLSLATAAALGIATFDTAAMGFGRILSRTTLGQPLNLALSLRLDAGETLDAGCIQATVLAGDQRIPNDQVRVRLTGGGDERIVRITTGPAIDEPVVTVTVSAGCPVRLSREFVTFADPPGFALAEAAPPAAPVMPAAPLAAEAPRVEPRPPETRTPAPAAAPATRPARRVAAARPPAQRTAPPRLPRPAAAAPAPGSRLKLDVAEPVRSAAPAVAPTPVAAATVAAAASAVAPAASAADETAQALAAAAAAASANAARLQALDQELARLRAESQAQRETLLGLRSQLASSQAVDRWWPWLVGLLLALLALVAWLAWRVQALARERAEWWRDAQRVPAPDAPSAPMALAAAAPVAEAGVQVTEHESTIVPPLPDTMPHPADVEAAEARREVSIEEQIDLEQQADFFIVLGQDDAAIDLLLTHLRGTGGTSPMPYLKLLEIHRRRGERDAYERTRVRFNQRFNGVAPEWDADPQGGRALEDYPQVLARVQRAWHAPLDAMAELETLLFRRGDGAERFDMAAYQDVVTLYRMARDLRLLDEQGPDSSVDVLLPLGSEPLPVVPPAAPAAVPEPPAVPHGPIHEVDIELSEPLRLDLPPDDTPRKPLV